MEKNSLKECSISEYFYHVLTISLKVEMFRDAYKLCQTCPINLSQKQRTV